MMRWGNGNAATPSYVTDGSSWSNYLGMYHLDQAEGANAPDSVLSQCWFTSAQYPPFKEVQIASWWFL